MPKQPKDLSREHEPKQETEGGLTIPVPTKREVMDLFERAATKPEPQRKANGRGRHRKRRDP
jgi:hypothetical protein